MIFLECLKLLIFSPLESFGNMPPHTRRSRAPFAYDVDESQQPCMISRCETDDKHAAPSGAT